MSPRFLVAVALAAAACKPQADAPSGQPAGAAELQALLDEAVAKGVPGVSAAIADSSGVIWTGVAGEADIQANTLIRPDMLFGVGSITKTFAAVVLLQLAEEGKLDFDATAASILGAAVDGIPNADKATLAQLLNHTSGVTSWEDDPKWIREGRGSQLDPKRIWGKTETLPYIKGHAPLFEPGTKYSYSNTNYTLLGMVIETVTGNDAVAEIHRRILDPLGLTDIRLEGFEPVPTERIPRRYHWATPAFREGAGVNPAFTEPRPGLIDASGSNLSVEWTAGGMIATARDLARYGVALRDGKLLKPESMRFLTDWYTIDEQSQVGHNVFRRTYPSGAALVGHDGDVLGFTGSLYWIEGAGVVVAVVANVGSMHSTSAGTGTAAADQVPGTAYLVSRQPRFIELATKLGTK
ncbi:MAG: serine hydrolase domain-containing protein [Gemmatimonadales bacterium]